MVGVILLLATHGVGKAYTPYVLFSSLEYKMGESAFTIVPLYWSKHDSEEEDGGGGIACAPLPSVQLLIIRGKLV